MDRLIFCVLERGKVCSIITQLLDQIINADFWVVNVLETGKGSKRIK